MLSWPESVSVMKPSCTLQTHQNVFLKADDLLNTSILADTQKCNQSLDNVDQFQTVVYWDGSGKCQFSAVFLNKLDLRDD